MANSSPRKLNFLSGMVAGIVMVAAMLLIAVLSGMPSIPEIVAELILLLIPVGLLSQVLTSLEYYAKPLFFAGFVLFAIVASGLLGMIYGRLASPREHARTRNSLTTYGWLSGLAYGGLLWILTSIGFLVSTLAIPAEQSAVEPMTLIIALLVSLLVYGVVLGLFSSQLLALRPSTSPAPPGEADSSRRKFVIRVVMGLAALSAGGILLQVLDNLFKAQTTKTTVKKPGGLTPSITPTEKFYIVSKNFSDPVVPVSQWNLSIRGRVDSPFELSYDELLALPYVEQYLTLECISNEVGGDLISTALWRGVRLRDLLEMAGVSPSVSEVAFYAWDDYSDSIPISLALQDSTLIAYMMNGEALPPRHGFPARLLAPGRYGMKNLKWVTAIEPVGYAFQGFWEQRGWSSTAIVKTGSRIDVPENNDILAAEKTQLGGIAFAGDRGIEEVQVSTDGGRTWQFAAVEPALSPFTWTLWLFDWTPDKTGLYTLLVRAIDGTGIVQTAIETDTLPDGASGLHSVTVRIV